jgi:beta-aspartyl-peptidase (threonine type)
MTNETMSSSGTIEWSIAIHGGAGTIPRNSLSEEKERNTHEVLRKALEEGAELLKKGGRALDAVAAAVSVMEDSPLFNAGRGSVFNFEGRHEMDASLMNGSDRQTGAVTGLVSVKNPVLLCKEIIRSSEHVLLSGAGAEEFATKHGFEKMPPEYFFDDFRYEQWQSVKGTSNSMLDHTNDKKFGTVGAVAMDTGRHLAAATSTGGMTNKMYGRIGDTPIPGAGTWADDLTCAVSCTGHGEYFMRYVAAYDIACLMEYKKLSLQEAVSFVVHDKLRNAGGEGGVIAVDGDGRIVMEFNSEGMYRGSLNNLSGLYTAIYNH